MWNRDDLAKATFEAKEHYHLRETQGRRFRRAVQSGATARYGHGQRGADSGKVFGQRTYGKRSHLPGLPRWQGEHNTKPSPSGPASYAMPMLNPNRGYETQPVVYVAIIPSWHQLQSVRLT